MQLVSLKFIYLYLPAKPYGQFFVRIPYLDASNRMDRNSACLGVIGRMDKKNIP